MKTNNDYININKRLQRIKDMGLTPITLKSASDIAQKIISPMGMSDEGLILSYKDASKMARDDRNEQLTIEEYNKTVQLFMREFGEQTYQQGAIDYAYERGKGVLHYISENIGDINPDFDINKLSKRQVVEMLQYAGNKINELKVVEQMNYKNGNSPTEFLDYVDQWYSEHIGE